jgi:uncharacterized protein
MVRPRKIKTVNFEPNITYFKPRAVPLAQLEEVEITIDELETLRLTNLEKFNQTIAAKKMNIHQSTFHRTLVRAREKLTDGIINGKAIKIHGGEYKIHKEYEQNCICSICGYKENHQRGIPCINIKCPECNKPLTRK